MNAKQAKKLRKTAKSIYDTPTAYDDVYYKAEPFTKLKDNNPSYFMNGSLAKRVMKKGCTRRFYQELKAGYKNRGIV